MRARGSSTDLATQTLLCNSPALGLSFSVCRMGTPPPTAQPYKGFNKISMFSTWQPQGVCMCLSPVEEPMTGSNLVLSVTYKVPHGLIPCHHPPPISLPFPCGPSHNGLCGCTGLAPSHLRALHMLAPLLGLFFPQVVAQPGAFHNLQLPPQRGSP